MNYKKYAFELLSALNGNIRYSDLIAYIESKGFVFIEFNTDNGDNTAKMLEIYDNCINCDGKTIIRNGVKTVAIDGNLCVDDKIRVTLHEIGHILLHIPNISNMADTTVIGRDNEAEAFVHEVLKINRYGLLFTGTFRTATVAMFCLAIIVSGMFIFTTSTDKAELHPNITLSVDSKNTPDVTSAVAAATPIQNDNLVYITPTGKKYHRPDCSSVNLSKARSATVEEAEKQGLQPCKKCNP